MTKPLIDVRTLKEVHFKYWSPEQRRKLRGLNEFADTCHSKKHIKILLERLLGLALEVLEPLEHVDMICGPISTGGTGKIYYNIRIFRRMIEFYNIEHGHPIFSQIPFETVLRKVTTIHVEWINRNGRTSKNEYCKPIMEHFYDGMFRTGKFRRFYFIPGWMSSRGALYEFHYAERHKIEIVEINNSTLFMIKRWLRIPVWKKFGDELRYAT